jgi:hypothetical protein
MYYFFPGQVVVVQNSINSGYKLYCASGWTKIQQFPPPDQGGYATPWLWVEGHYNPGPYTGTWENYVANALNDTSLIGINVSTTYNPGSKTGTATAVFMNDSTDTVKANAYFLVTLDSVNYNGGNGQVIHNHAVRSYIPGPTGTSIKLPPGGVDTLVENFSVTDTWSTAQGNIVVFLQSPTVRSDSSKITFNAAITSFGALTGVAEQKPTVTKTPALVVGPNPCRGLLSLQLNASGSQSKVEISDVMGRLVKSLTVNSEGRTTIDTHAMAEGVYFVALSGLPETAQKVVVQR